MRNAFRICSPLPPPPIPVTKTGIFFIFYLSGTSTILKFVLMELGTTPYHQHSPYSIGRVAALINARFLDAIKQIRELPTAFRLRARMLRIPERLMGGSLIFRRSHARNLGELHIG